jgi:hypothetical protein
MYAQGDGTGKKPGHPARLASTMTRGAFRRLGATGVALMSLESGYQVTQKPQGLFWVLVDNDTLNLLLLLIRKGNDFIRHD